jgi:hypothetical protein
MSSRTTPRRRRLGIYSEVPYRRDEGGFSTHVPFIRFVLALRPHFDGLVLIGRVDPEPDREPYAIPDDVEVAALPHYASLKDTTGIVGTLPATLRARPRTATGMLMGTGPIAQTASTRPSAPQIARRVAGSVPTIPVVSLRDA